MSADQTRASAYEAVVFDLFGTLTSNLDMADHLSAVARMGRAIGFAPDDFVAVWRACHVDRFVGKFASESDNMRWICEQHGIDPTVEQLAEAYEHYLDFCLPYLLNPRPDAEGALRELRSNGLRIGLLTDCGPWVAANWHRSPLSDLVDAQVFSPEVGARKPDPRSYDRIVNALGVEPGRTLFVGDGNSRELSGALDFGMDAVKIQAYNGVSENPDADYDPEQEWKGPFVRSLDELVPLTRAGQGTM